jgi:CRP-like cAMP-binding protein
MSEEKITNRFLVSLPAAEYLLLHTHLRPIDLVYEAVLIEVGEPIERVYFPHTGIISLIVRLADGQAVEAAMIGIDGVLGSMAAFDGQTAMHTAVVQMSGKASTLEISHLRVASMQSPRLLGLLLRYEQMVYAQALQSVACNAAHTVQSRLSRWLLRARDLSGSDTLTFSQEFLAQMLGAHRNSVSTVAIQLQELGLIRYSRGRIEILDVNRLRGSSCECYAAQKNIADTVWSRSLD